MSARFGSRLALSIARGARNVSANGATSALLKGAAATSASRSLIPMAVQFGAAASSHLPVTFASQQCFYASSQSSNETSNNSGAEESASTKEGSEEEAKSIEELQALLKQHEDKAAKATQQVEQLTDALKRSLADMENLRVRTTREVENTKKFALQNFVKALFDVADNLERAAGVVPADVVAEESTADAAKLRKLLKGLLEGVQATETIMMNVLKKQGVVRFDPTGEPFDPNFHSALFDMADPTKENGTVAIVTKRGYSLNERVIRPAEVGVVRNQ